MDYVKSIEAWAKNRGLDKTSSDKQLIKLVEEVGELAEAHNKEWRDKQIDSLGDIFVVLTIYALQNGLRIDDCVKEAYNTIKDRDGKIIDGVFVKKSDLEERKDD
ncbi:MazG-like family protein [Levilactobacillus brevis]|uniref:MazG-like family protein n=1 Tax=Levilactobacillus brevis TaxID=1580 RepID=UPI001C1EAAF8|nr:MazG-like family protein [Levilactobacillus brevis]MBU7558880.1 MazG-like family protein [Levilactobacillus brevis]MCE6010488.1 MazG-like family protein [Levilactobacillus brevis]MCE6025050.1 MazG-like family protein [Levilactobacillus brevis]MCE6035850.1 MazG-like family protein [Levilactobacillus brevis]